MPPKIAGPVVAGKKAKGETINAKLALVMKSGKVGAAPCVVHPHAEHAFVWYLQCLSNFLVDQLCFGDVQMNSRWFRCRIKQCSCLFFVFECDPARAHARTLAGRF
jgi:hypothetical protein